MLLILTVFRVVYIVSGSGVRGDSREEERLEGGWNAGLEARALHVEAPASEYRSDEAAGWNPAGEPLEGEEGQSAGLETRALHVEAPASDYRWDEAAGWNPAGEPLGQYDEEDVASSGGGTADITKFPWTVAIMIDNSYFCSGTLVTDRHVLTAAHCVTLYKHKNYTLVERHRLSVRAGSTSRSSGGETRQVDEVTVHPDFLQHQQVALYRDLAVVRLHKRLPLGERIASAALPDSRMWVVLARMQQYAETCRVAGWGHGGSDSLHVALVPVLREKVCSKRAHEYYGSTVDGETQMCTMAKKQGLCGGDSGGGLVCGRAPVVWGVTSWEGTCGQEDAPGIYSRVDTASDFIARVTNHTLLRGKRREAEELAERPLRRRSRFLAASAPPPHCLLPSLIALLLII